MNHNFSKSSKITLSRSSRKLKRSRRRFFIFWAVILAALIGWAGGGAYLINQVPKNLEVNFLAVGQGDASLIKTPSRQVILIDGGPDNSVLTGLGKDLPFYRRRIDVVVVSHYHDDHVAGLIEILKRYRVKKVIYPAGSPTSEISELFLSTATHFRIPIIYLSGSAQLDLGENCVMNLLNPAELGVKANDNNSLVAHLDCRQTKFLFTGDNNSKVEQAIIDSGQDWRADILKASHHGSITANSVKFLAYVQPKLMVISVGLDNRFGHPNPVILERAIELGINVKRTDQDGEARIVD
jgi:competence protein ComEC